MARNPAFERKHPRDREGQFREKTTGWVGQLSDRIGLRSAKELLTGPPNTSYPEVAAELEGRYGSGGMRVHDVGVSLMGGDYHDAFRPEHGGHLEISGAIGDEGGYFRVTAHHGPENIGDPNKWSVHLDRMHSREAKGGGGGRELTARLVDWFRRSGFDEVTVGPSEVGSYAWGAMGFDFQDHESRRIAWEGAMTMNLESVRDHFRYQSGYDNPDYSDGGLTDVQIKRMIRQYRLAATRALAGTMSYQSLSQYGRKPGQGKDDWWAGKLGLIVGGVGGGRIKL